MRTVIIDDEAKARDNIRRILSYSECEIDIVGEAACVSEGIDIIIKLDPDLVILDIKMPDGSGFDLLKQLPQHHFKLVFITAYEEFAIRAFEFSAIDYLLKPIDPLKLLQTIQKIKDLVRKDQLSLKMVSLFANLKSDNISKKLVLRTESRIHIIETKNIVFCESNKGYTTFHLKNHTKIVVSKNLKYYESLLVDFGYFRPHQSYLINMNYIDYYHRKDGGYIQMKGGRKIPISFRNRERFLYLLNSL